MRQTCGLIFNIKLPQALRGKREVLLEKWRVNIAKENKQDKQKRKNYFLIVPQWLHWDISFYYRISELWPYSSRGISI